jgi:hypothetical protein
MTQVSDLTEDEKKARREETLLGEIEYLKGEVARLTPRGSTNGQCVDCGNAPPNCPTCWARLTKERDALIDKVKDLSEAYGRTRDEMLSYGRECDALKAEQSRIEKLRGGGCSICQRPFRFQEEHDAGVCAACVLDVKEVERLRSECAELKHLHDVMRAETVGIRRAALEEAAKVAEGGRFLHDDAPDAQFGKACAAAIRRISKEVKP